VRYRTVLFDLDGTLIDSGAMILASFRHATRTVLEREVSDEVLLAAVGGATLSEQMRLLDERRVTDLVEAYRAHNLPLHQGLVPCAGVLEVLEVLRIQGRRLGVVTSKRMATVELAFEVIPLGRFFRVVVTADDTERHKPHPEPLQLALARLDEEPGRAVYVGDSPFDVRAAKAAGVAAVAVGWGGIHANERLALEEPDELVPSGGGLLDVL